MSKQHKITIDAINSEGEGVGTLQGLKVFVTGALIGEDALITITEQKKSYAKADLVKIVSPSPHRTSPPCPYFGVCGGCQIMHLSYPAQLDYKRQKVVDALKRIASLDIEVAPCMPSPLSFSYRNKMQLPLIWHNEKKQMGFFKKRTHEIIPIKECLIQSSLGNKILQFIIQTLTLSSVRYVLIKTSNFTNEALVTFVTTGREKEPLKKYALLIMNALPEVKGVVENINLRNDNIILTPNERLVAGQDYIVEKLLNKKFKISSNSFFQVNPSQAEALFSKALELSAITKDQLVVDAYCGVGTFALLSSDLAREVIGIELSTQAIANAKENALLNGCKNCTFYAGDSEKLLSNIPNIDLLLINPPRKGCTPQFLQKVEKILPKTLIYISCDPATLSRDLTLLPHYQPTFVQPFDMFPQTTHVETLVKLELRTLF